MDPLAGRRHLTRFGAVVVLGLLAPGCAREHPTVLLEDDLDLIVTWSGTDRAGSGEVRVRPRGAAVELSAGGDLRIFAYRSPELLRHGADAARLDRTPVRALDGCGPQLPPAARAFAISFDGDVADISDGPMPPLEALALPCDDPGGAVFATPATLAAPCSTSSAGQQNGCTLCFDLAACGIAGPGQDACAAPLLPIRTELDGTICTTPAPGSPCQEGLPRQGADVVLDCARDVGGPLTIDVVRSRGQPRLDVTPFDLSTEAYDGRDDDAPVMIVAGLLSDLMRRGDQLIVIRRELGDHSRAGCHPSSFGTILFVSLEGQIQSEVVPTRPCLLRLAPDPLDPGGFVGGHLVASERIARIVRYDALGNERALVGELALEPELSGPGSDDILHALAVTGTTGAARITAFVVTQDAADTFRTSWATWAFGSGAWTERAGGVIENAAFYFVEPLTQPALEGSILVSNDTGASLVIFDPLRGVVESISRRVLQSGVSQGPVTALSTGDRWLVASGGRATGGVTLFDRQGDASFAGYLLDNEASITDVIEIAPNLVLAAVLRGGPEPQLSELVIAGVGMNQVWLEPRALPVGPGMIGRFVEGERCPDGVRTRVVWALAAWAGDLLRVVLPCD